MSICRSVCITVFGTYRGALTIGLRILFWNLGRKSMFDLFAVPQRGTPYVQIGLRIVLYINSLVSTGIFDFLPTYNPVHSMELQAKLFSFGKYMFLPCQTTVEVNT